MRCAHCSRGLAAGVTRIFVSTLAAQQPVNTMQGLIPLGTYQTGSVDNVYLMNGGLGIVIPLGGGAPQRGAVSAQVEVVINSKAFYVAGGQWQGSAMSVRITNAQRISVQQVESHGAETYEATTGDGGVHILEGGQAENGYPYPGYRAIDGSGIYYSSATDTAVNRDGIKTIGASSTTGAVTLEDANGNEIALSNGFSYTDTVGRAGGAEQATSDTSGCTGAGPWAADNITFPGYGGQTLTWKLWNGYSYVKNTPLIATDPWGLTGSRPGIACP